MKTYNLTWVYEGASSSPFTWEGNDRLIVGRDLKNCTFVLPTNEQSVSKKHLEIYLFDEKLVARNISQQNWFQVKRTGHVVMPAESVHIQEGDTLLLGNVELYISSQTPENRKRGGKMVVCYNGHEYNYSEYEYCDICGQGTDYTLLYPRTDTVNTKG